MIMERKEAIEVIKKNYPHVNESGSQFETALRILIPELKESGDERIRKELIEFVKSRGGFKQEYIAWLEKQGENAYNKELSELLHKVICRFINDPYIPYSDREKVSMKVLPYVERLEKQGEKGINGNEREIPFTEQEWSKEDEKALKVVTNVFEQHGVNLLSYPYFVHWLKALPNRITFNPYWKPSDEQMKQLGWVAEQNKDNIIGKELMTLYKDLKKLRG